MPAVNSDEKWEICGKGAVVAHGVIPCTRSLPSSPPRIDQLEKMSLSRMLGEYHREEIREDLLMTSSLPSGPLPLFQAVGLGEPSMEMTNDLLDLTKPLPWDKLKRGASTMSLDSLNENYMESVPGETSALEDLDKTPVATCTCGKMTNFECWIHRVPFGEAGELTEEISQTCLQLVRELRSATPESDTGRFTNKLHVSDKNRLDIHAPDDGNQYIVESPPSNHVRVTGGVDTPCSWKRELSHDQSVNGDTPSSKSSGSLASAASAPKSEVSSSPDSYVLLYKSFEVAVEMDRLQMERGQSEGSSVGSSLESLNRTSPKLQKVLSQKRRSSPDGSGESPRDSLSSLTGSLNNQQNNYDFTSQPSATDICHYEIELNEDSYAIDGAAQKVTFASLAKKKKKTEVQVSQMCPTEVTHWTELVSVLVKDDTEPLHDTIPEEAPISIPEVGNKAKRPHSLPIQLRHIQKPSSRPQQTPEQSQGSAGSMTLGFKGVTRTISAPEGFSCSLPRSAGSGQDFLVSKTASWVLPAFSQSTSGLSLLSRHLNSQRSWFDSAADQEQISCSEVSIGSPLITTDIPDSGNSTRNYPFRSNGNAAKGSAQAGRPRVLAMDINANFTEPQEQDTFIPEHHHFIPQELNSETDSSPMLRNYQSESLLKDRLHLGSDVGVESSSDWVPGPRCTWLDVSRRTMQPPRTLDLLNRETWQQQQHFEKLQTCSRGCSTDSPPAMDMESFLKIHLGKETGMNLKAKEPPKEFRDVGVSTDAALTEMFWMEDHLCPCATSCCHLAEPSPKIKQEDGGTCTVKCRPVTPKSCLSDREMELKMETKSEVSSDKVSNSACRKGQREELKVPKISQKRPSGKKAVKAKDSKTVDKTTSQAKKRKDNTGDKPSKKTVQSWRVGDRTRRDSLTTVICEESRFKDALTNRVVRIENVGASTLPTSSDKRYIPHRPLKPIRQVDAEHQRRKAVLQKLYGNDTQPTAPLPPTVVAWPSLWDSMHSRAERFHSLPTNLSHYDGTSLNLSQSQCSSSQDRPIKRILSWESGAARYGPHDDVDAQLKGMKQRPLRLDVSRHYDASADCLPPQEMQVSPRENEEEVNLVQKKALVTSVESAVEHILNHFAQARTKSLEEKGRLGSSAHSPDIGHLMLHYLCPAIRALLTDGLRPYVASFFVGRLKTTLWDVVEATTQLGPGTRPLHELVRHLLQFSHLKTSDLRVNAFIMGLLNIRCLELWLEHIRDHPDVVRSLYEPNAFLSLCNGATKDLFDHLLIAVQPLTLLPFDLEYNFEHQRLVHKQHQQRERQQLMEQHSSNASNSLLLEKSHDPVGGSWFRGTASLFWKSREPEQPSATKSTTSSLSKNQNRQNSVDRTKNSQSSERPARGSLKTDENATPMQGVESPRDLIANKEAGNSWSLDWIKGFVKASSETSNTSGGMSGTRPVMSSGSAWSRFGSSISKAFDRIRSDGPAVTTQPHPPEQTTPKRPEETETAPSMQRTTSTTEPPSSPVSPGSPVKARCHHVTMSQEELSFAKGSILTVEEQVDPDWLMCKQGDQSGLVHIDYVQGME